MKTSQHSLLTKQVDPIISCCSKASEVNTDEAGDSPTSRVKLRSDRSTFLHADASQLIQPQQQKNAASPKDDVIFPVHPLISHDIPQCTSDMDPFYCLVLLCQDLPLRFSVPMTAEFHLPSAEQALSCLATAPSAKSSRYPIRTSQHAA